MSIHTLTFEDGSVFEVEGARNASEEELVAKIKRGEGTKLSSFERIKQDVEAARLRREAEPAPVIDPVQPEETGIFGDLRKGFGSGFVGTFETGALGAATLLDEEAELAARDRIQGIAAALKPKGGDQDDISYKVGQAFGSIAGFAGAGAGAVGLASLAPALAPIAGGIGLGVAGTLGIGTAAGEASERARAAGATEEERTRAVRRAAPFGLLEVAPLGRLVRKIDVPFVQKLVDDLGGETVETIAQRIRSAAVTGGVEGAQEATSEIIQNLVERGYNPERAILESSGESALLGGGAGATLQFFVDAFTNSRKAGVDGLPQEAVQGELDLQSGAGAAPRIGVQTNFEGEQGEMFPRADLGQAPERPAERDTRQAEFDFDERVEEPQEPDLVDRMQQKLLTGPDDLGLTVDSRGEARTRDQKAAARAKGMQTVERARVELQETGALSMATLQNLRSAPVPFEAVASVLKNTRYEPALSLIEGSELPPAFGVTPSNLGPIELQDPERLKTAVANAQGGIGALLGRQSAAKQLAARDRMALQAADRGDVDAFEQPDLLAAELEQAQRERPEAALRDDLRAQEKVDPVTSKITKTETEPELLERDLFNAAEIGTQDTSQNIRKAREAARQKQEDIDVDTELGLREMQTEVADRKRSEQLSLFNLPLQSQEIARLDHQSAKKQQAAGDQDAGDQDAGDQDAGDQDAGDQDAGDQAGQGPSRAGDADAAPSGDGEPGAASAAKLITPDDERVGDAVPDAREATLREGQQPSAVGPPPGFIRPYTKDLQPAGEDYAESNTMYSPLGRQRATQRVKDYGKALVAKLKGTKAVSRNRRGATDTTSRLSNKLHKAILDNLDNKTQKASATNTRYFGKYLNVENAIEDAYTDALITKGKGEQGLAPAVAKNVIDLVNKNKTKQDEKILAELERLGELNRINIDSKKTLDDVNHGDRRASTYVETLLTPVTGFVDALKAGNLTGALEVLSGTDEGGGVRDPFVRHMAGRFKTLLKGYGVTLKVKKGLTNKDGAAVQGLYDAASKTIFLDNSEGRMFTGDRLFDGMNAHTLLHEVAHALTIKIATTDVKNLKTQSEKAAKKKLTATYDEAVRLLQTEADGDFATYYGLGSEAEFMAEIMSNQKFRNILLRTAQEQEQTLLGKIKSMVRTLVGKPSSVTTDQLNGLVEAVMRPDPKYVGEGTYALGGRENAKKTMGDIGKVQRKLKAELPSRQTISDNFSDFVGNAKAAPRNVFLKLLASQSLADVASRYGFGNLGYDVDGSILRQRGGIIIATDLTKIKVTKVQAIFKKMGIEKVAKLNELIYSPDFGATIYQVDPFMDPTDARKRYKDKQSSDPNRTLLDIYNEQKKFINDSKLRGNGQRAYTLMRDHYKEQYERARAIVLKEIEALGNEAGTDGAKIASKVKKDIYNKMFQGGTLEVYFPLVREGDYKLTYGLKDPKQPRDAYIVEMFTTRAERERAFKEIKADPKFTNPEKKDGELTIADYQKAPDASFAFDVVTALSKTKGPKGETIPPQAIEEVMRLFIATLPETSFAKSLQKRKGVLGYKEDSMFALRTKGYDIAVQSQKLKAASEIRAVEREISKVKKPDNVSLSAFEDTQAELLSRGVFARQGAKSKSFEDVGRRLNQFAFVYTIGFNASSALVNLSQIPLFVQPYLGGKYGQAETAKAIYKAGALTKNVKNSLRDFYDMDLDGNISLKSDPNMSDTMRQELLNIMPLVKEAAERGQLISQGYIAESMGLDEASRAKRKSIGGVADWVSGLSAYLFNHAEKYNRQTTMVAAYNLHLDKLTGGKQPTSEQQQEAANEAIYMTQEANGGAYLETGPSIARENVGRVALMYKSYGLQMYYSMFKQAKRMIDAHFAGDKQARNEAFRMLGGLHGSALLLAGVQGIPIYGAVRLVFNLLADDEQEDFDAAVRRTLGEGWYKGPIVAATGLDTASRTALTGLLIQENKYNPDPSLEETIGFYIGGPALSSATRIVRGVQDLGNGQIERGVENLMPTAVANAYKGLVRYQRDGGVYTRRGDPMYDDLNFMESSGLVLGIQPAGYTQASAINRTLKTIDKAVNAKRSKLTKLYYVALRQGDMEGVREAIAEMGKFNKRHPAAAITHGTLKRSLDRHVRTSGEMYNGVALSPIYRGPLRELAASYEDLSP
jgi:hypothetical protein